MIDFDLFQIIPCSAKAIKVIVKVSSQQLHHRGAGNGPSHISATSRNKAQSCSLHGTHSIAPSKCVLNSSELRGRNRMFTQDHNNSQCFVFKI